MTATIRLANADDAVAIREIYAPIIEDTSISFELDPPSHGEVATRIQRTLETHPWLVMEEQGAVSGYAYGSVFRVRAAYRWSCEVSVYVAERAQGRGVGSRLYATLFDFLAQQGYWQAYAGITLPNDPSVALHEGMGFAPCGVFRAVGFKFDAWHDVGWWQRALEHAETAPGPIQTVADVAAGFDWDAPR